MTKKRAQKFDFFQTQDLINLIQQTFIFHVDNNN